MQQEVENSLYVSIATGKAASPFLILPIRRDHLVEDSLNNVTIIPSNNPQLMFLYSYLSNPLEPSKNHLKLCLWEKKESMKV